MIMILMEIPAVGLDGLYGLLAEGMVRVRLCSGGRQRTDYHQRTNRLTLGQQNPVDQIQDDHIDYGHHTGGILQGNDGQKPADAEHDLEENGEFNTALVVLEVLRLRAQALNGQVGERDRTKTVL